MPPIIVAIIGLKDNPTLYSVDEVKFTNSPLSQFSPYQDTVVIEI